MMKHKMKMKAKKMNQGGRPELEIDDFGRGRQPLPPIETIEPRMRGMRESMAGGRRMAKGGMAKSGGSFRKAADGIASKGKTKGKMVKMAYGGKC